MKVKVSLAQGSNLERPEKPHPLKFGQRVFNLNIITMLRNNKVKIGAMAPYVIVDPDSKITPGKIYPIIILKSHNVFFIRNDNDVKTYCLWYGCAHINENDWIRKIILTNK